MRAPGAHTQAWARSLLFVLLLCVAAAVRAVTPANTDITNTATVAYDVAGTTIQSTGSTTVTTATNAPASIQFLSYVPNGTTGTSAVAVSPTQCAAGGNWATLGHATVPGNTTLPMPGTYPLAPASAYSGRDMAFLQVMDFSANRDGAVREWVAVQISTPTGDIETVKLQETGVSTGLFVGYLPLASGPVQPGNCTLQAKTNEKLTATYVQSGTSAIATSVALVDPLGLVFDSATGQPIDGVRVTLIDIATGQAAQVRGDDGVSTFPSTVLTGSTVTDSGGTVYVLGPGRYQFPRVSAPGTYRLQIEPPAGYRFPSKVPDATLQQLAGAPFQLSAISRGGQFTVLPGPPVEADVPLDPGPLGTVDLTKTAGKSIAAVGDFVPYSVGLSTASDVPLPNVQLQDRLPPGFRYMPGSARLNDRAIADPAVSPDGRTLLFSIGTVPARSSAMLRYVAAIGPSAAVGPARNLVQSIGRIASNIAGANVVVRDELNRSRIILAGQVTVAPSCEADEKDRASRQPLGGVRLLLQDGTYVVTDLDGNWHIDNLRPGTHVVQVDTGTLPQHVQLRSCEGTTARGGRDFSQLVNVHAGSLWRADFRFAPVASCLRQEIVRTGKSVDLTLSAPVSQEGVTATVLLPAGSKVQPGSVLVDGKAADGVQVSDDAVVFRLAAQPSRWQRRLAFALADAPAGEFKVAVRATSRGVTANLPALSLGVGADRADECAALPAANLAPAPAVEPTTPVAGVAPAATGDAPALIEQLPYDDKWLAAAEPGAEWLHPKADFVPALPLVKVAVKHAATETVELRVNGAPVNPLRFDGSLLGPTGAIALSNWRAVDLRDGPNTLEVLVRDAGGATVLRESRQVHYGVTPARAELVAAKSRLVADARTPPVIAVRFLDGSGKPIRRGAAGEFSVAAPFAPQQQADAIQQEPLSGSTGGRPRYEIGEDGVALIRLRPTSQTGEAVLNFDFGANRSTEVRAWLQSDQREWILVGFAEGTLGHKTLSGNMEALKDAGGADQLFDQNRLAFFAKGMVRGEYLLTAAYDSAKERGTGVNPALRQGIDPTAYYTLYGDATQQGYDAASIRKLYLKIEKQQFYVLFGDFDTGLTVTELGRYSRTVNGLKSEYRGETFGYSAFATRTSQAFLKDEIQGDGTSGLYRLRARGVVANSDKARVETRDRLQPDRVLSVRNLAPWLDYQIDYALGTLFLREPLASRDADGNLQVLVVDYETEGGAGESWTYGGRASMQVNAATTLGVTRIHEGDLGRQGTLTAADATVKLDDATKVRVEAATSSRQADIGTQSGNAVVAEVLHDDGNLAYRAYAREQQAGFGLGQQSVAAQGLRRVGVDGRVKATDALQVQGEVSRQQDLTSGAERDLVEARGQWTVTENVKVQAGARVVREGDGQGGEAQARQATAGVQYDALDHRLVLRASTELDVGSRSSSSTTATAYPNRLVLGADYKLTPETTLTAQHETIRGGGVRMNTASVGIRTRPWEGAEVKAGVGDQATLDADRIYASLGLVQRVHLNDRWTADAGIEQTRTLNGTLRPDATGAVSHGVVPVTSPAASLPSGSAPASGYGLVAGDFTAITTGLAYRDGDWSGNGRLEWRNSDVDRKVNASLGAQKKLGRGEALAAGIQWTRQESAIGGLTSKLDSRVSYAWRPSDGDWMLLDRIEYVQETSEGASLAGRLFTRKLINNLNANWKPRGGTQIALQYSSKFVRESLQDFNASGYTDLLGIEARYDLTPKLDVGLHAGLLHSWATHSRAYHLGLSVGYRVATNMWVSVGYNAAGFWDADFVGAEYRAKGLYLNIRAKFDQDTFDLNDRRAADALQAR